MYYFIYGEDTYRSRKKLKELIARSGGESGVITADSSREDIVGALESHCSGANLFGESPLLLILYPLSGLPENSEWILKNLLRCETSSANFIFWDSISLAAGKGKKAKKASRLQSADEAVRACLNHAKKSFEYPLLENSSLLQYIRAMAEEKNLAISPTDLSMLSEASAGDLWMAEHELEKYALTGVFRRDTARAAVEKLYDFTDAVMTGDTARALELLERTRESGFDDIYIAATLAGVLRNMLKVKSILPANPDYRTLGGFGMHDFVLKKTLSHARRFRLEDLKRLYRLTMDLDVALKTSPADSGAIFTRFIAAFA